MYTVAQIRQEDHSFDGFQQARAHWEVSQGDFKNRTGPGGIHTQMLGSASTIYTHQRIHTHQWRLQSTRNRGTECMHAAVPGQPR